MSALTERLAGQREQPGLERLVEAARGGETRAPGLERTQAQLPEALALEEHPVVVPVRQEIAVEYRCVEVGRGTGLVVERLLCKRLHLV